MGKITWVLNNGIVKEFHQAIVYEYTSIPYDEVDIDLIVRQWKESTSGQFVQEHSRYNPVLHFYETAIGETKIAIEATLEKKKYSEFLLKFSKNNIDLLTKRL